MLNFATADGFARALRLSLQLACFCVALIGGGAAHALPTCSSTTSWGSLGPPGVRTFGNSFGSAGTYVDCYSFSLSAPAQSFGGVLEIDPFFNRLDIDVSWVRLYFGNTLLSGDSSTLTFGFGGLTGGPGTATYTLAFRSLVTNDPGIRNTAVGYLGAIRSSAAPTSPVSTSVPEPGTLALLGLGLVGLGLSRRKAKA